jgi:hypothetical protein
VIHPDVAVAADVVVADPVVDAVAVVFALEPEVVSVAVVVFEIVDVAEPQVSADIVLAFVVLIPVSVVVVSVNNPEHPTFSSFPNIGYPASFSSSVEVVNEEHVDNSSCVRANYGSDSILSNMGRHHNKNLEHDCNKPNHDHNTVSDTSDLPTDATRNHSRRTGLRLHWAQHKHYWYRAIRLHLVVPGM